MHSSLVVVTSLLFTASTFNGTTNLSIVRCVGWVDGLGMVHGLGEVRRLRRVVGSRGRRVVRRRLGVVRHGCGGRMVRGRLGRGVVRRGLGSRLVGDHGLRVIGIVARLALVLHVGDVAVLVVGVVRDNLCAPIGEGHAVLTGHHTILILSLLLVKVRTGILILDAVLVGEGSGRNLVRIVGNMGRMVRCWRRVVRCWRRMVRRRCRVVEVGCQASAGQGQDDGSKGQHVCCWGTFDSD